MAELDAIDLRILELLRSDGRMSVNALAREVGVSRANAYRRLDRLQDDGVIRGFAVQVDPARVGRPITAFVLISVQQQKWETIKEVLTGPTVDGVEYVAATTGEFDFFALVRIPDMATLRDVVLEQLHSTPGVVTTRTVFALEEVFAR